MICHVECFSLKSLGIFLFKMSLKLMVLDIVEEGWILWKIILALGRSSYERKMFRDFCPLFVYFLFVKALCLVGGINDPKLG